MWPVHFRSLLSVYGALNTDRVSLNVAALVLSAVA